MTGNELATAVQYGVPIKIFVSNNNAYGTIRMHQARSFPGRPTSTELINPDFAAWGEAFGAEASRSRPKPMSRIRLPRQWLMTVPA